MRSILLAAGIWIIMCGGPGSAASGNNGDGNTTVVRDSNGETVITQSGNPAQTEVHFDREPGQTTIYRRSGGNTAVVVQSSRGALPGQILDWLKKRSGP